MTATLDVARHGALIEPATLQIQRRLPGPIERAFSWLTDSDLRRQWLAAGEMPLQLGAEFVLTWRNDELTDPPGVRPEGFSVEHSANCVITALEAPRRLGFTFGDVGEVLVTFEPAGEEVLMTLVHSRLPSRGAKLGVSAGWHAHLDLLETKMRGEAPKTPFWDGMVALRADYDARIPA